MSSPVANPDVLELSENTPVVVDPADLLFNDTDDDGDALFLIGVGNAVNVTVSILPDGALSITPLPNYSGPASFSYTISDGNGGTSTTTVAISVMSEDGNTPPLAVDDSLSTNEDTPLVLSPATLMANDLDSNGDALALTAVGDAVNGTVSIDAGGNIVFTPAANFNGPASFSYTIDDGQGGTATATVDVNVIAVNDVPVATADAVSTNEDTPLIIAAATLTENDSDVDGNALAITAVGGAVHGTVSIDPAGNVVFTPAANYNGPASFSYTVSDGQGGSATATVSVNVAAVNDAPAAANDSVTATEDTPLVLAPAALLGNDTDVEGNTLAITGVGNATHGTVALSGGNVVFTPAADYNGPASFTYTVSDGQGGTSTATVSVNVTAVNDGPVTASDSVAATEDTPLVLAPAALLGNDTDADGNVLTITGVGNATHGTVALNGGNVVFTPASNYNGPASFTYTVSDGQGGTATATVNVNVAAVNDGPVATTDSVTATEDTPLVLAPAALLGNDTDADGNTLTILSVGNASHGSVVLNGGNVVFTPASNYNGPASFTYTVSDGQGGTATATVNVNVTAVNDGPVATNDSVTATEDTPLVLAPAALLGNDSDADGNALSILSVGNATHGTVALNGGNVVFTPASNYNGPGSFTYTVSDGQGGTATATVNVNIVGANDGPVAATDSVTATEDTPLVLAPAVLLGNDSDSEGNTLSILSVGNATHGTVALNGGNVVFTPASNYNGAASFTYTIGDGQGGTATATVNVNVTAANDGPAAANDSVTATEDTPLVLAPAVLLGNDSDVDGNALTIIGVGNATHGTVALNGGNVVFTPAANYNGPASFIYTVSDGQGGTATATVNVDVTAINDGPAAANDSIAATEDTPLVLAPAALLGNDSDADGNVLAITGVGNATHGTVALSGGNIVFTPAANYNGPASFTYTVRDGQGGSATATVNVTVTAVNDGPVAASDSVTATEDTPLVLAPAALLGNDSDADGNALTITGVGNATHGTVALSGGNIVFTPAANYNGPASFTYTVSDGHGGTSTATVNVAVNGGNDAPQPAPDSFEIAADTAVVFVPDDLLANDVDPDGDALFITGVGSAVHGTVTRSSDGAITFTPTPGYSGPASFVYTVTDGHGGQASTTVSLDVESEVAAAAPEVAAASASGNEDSKIPLSITCAIPDGASAQYVSILLSGVPAGATLSAGSNLGDGVWSLTAAQLHGLKLTPPKNSGADFTLTVTATGDGGSTTATLKVAVAAVADAPTLSVTSPTVVSAKGLVINGGNRDDLLTGGAGSDTISGGNGDDVIIGDRASRPSSALLGIKAALTDLDGSETLTIRISGVPDRAWLSAGTRNFDGSWTVAANQLSGLEVLFPAGTPTFTLSITAIATDRDPNSGAVDTEAVSATIQVKTKPEGNDVLHGGNGNDEIRGTGGNDTMTGDGGNDFLSGGLGNDSMTGDSGNDMMYGRDGNDNLSGGTGRDYLHGDGGNDKLYGGDDNDWMNGDSGNDTLSGDKGNDELRGEDGADSIAGGDDNDWLSGGSGNDTLSGDKGNDELRGDSGTDSMAGGDGNDWLSGGDDNDTLSGDKGNDDLFGGDGHDNLSGGDGHDDVSGGSGNDTLSGGNDDDDLFGDSGNDKLSGGAGQDWLEGGSGADTLTGGSGRDHFAFNSVGEGIDVVTDFGKDDVINIEDILPGRIDDGDEAIAGGFVRFLQSGADTLVQVDRNGGANGFQTLVVLQGVVASTLDADTVLDV